MLLLANRPPPPPFRRNIPFLQRKGLIYLDGLLINRFLDRKDLKGDGCRVKIILIVIHQREEEDMALNIEFKRSGKAFEWDTLQISSILQKPRGFR